ncbi:uncharacterized protein METZ01_LOCUS187063, partial [marine metagenome]
MLSAFKTVINFDAVFKTQWHKSGTNEDFLK